MGLKILQGDLGVLEIGFGRRVVHGGGGGTFAQSDPNLHWAHI